MKRWTFALMVTFLSLAACDDTTAPTDPVEGSYEASLFRVTPAGGVEIDVLAEGGSLEITIDENNATTGTLITPVSVEGGLNASMAGTAVVSGSTVTFQQIEDTFVRDLSWTRSTVGLTVSNQLESGAMYTITLRRQ